ncbi:unnamed protein product [Caenorhabditis auriculariae]|uniref:Uncharacterized protein n=1 Tax=Caenorhabditis auriculariae TaxID=2777116 RepID=A0A8S1HDW3_9PELO|nr:unnamed protein product [Caenorhabditis auriculariae]
MTVVIRVGKCSGRRRPLGGAFLICLPPHSIFVIVVTLLVSQITAHFNHQDAKEKRAAGDINGEGIDTDWNSLGWAWGKRSSPDFQIPMRYLRAVHPVKKNPDWHDLGWTWGRRK